MSVVPPSAKRRPQLGDLVKVIDPATQEEPVLAKVSGICGQYVLVNQGQYRFHVKDDLIASSKGDAWRLAGGGVVRFATAPAGKLDSDTAPSQHGR